MQFLAILRTLPEASTQRLAALMKPEAEMVWGMHLNGTLRSAHFIHEVGKPIPVGVSLLLEANDAKQAKALIDALPMVAEGLLGTEILPLAPFAAYGALFANNPVRD